MTEQGSLNPKDNDSTSFGNIFWIVVKVLIAIPLALLLLTLIIGVLGKVINPDPDNLEEWLADNPDGISAIESGFTQMKNQGQISDYKISADDNTIVIDIYSTTSSAEVSQFAKDVSGIFRYFFPTQIVPGAGFVQTLEETTGFSPIKAGFVYRYSDGEIQYTEVYDRNGLVEDE